MRRLNLTLPATLATGLTVAFLLFFIFYRLANELTFGLRLVIYAGSLAGIVLAVGAVVFFAAIGWEKWQQAGEASRQARAESRIKDMQSDEYRVRILAASKIIHTADPGQQVYMIDLLANLTQPLHLSPGPLNGRYIEPSDQEKDRWQIHQLAHAKRGDPLRGETPGQLATGQTLRPILPVLVEAQRAVIAGPSGAGKTTLLQHLVSERARFSQVVLIDPHGQKPKYGSLVDSIGCGMRFDEIDEALRAIDFLMVQRYEEIAAGADHRSHPNVTLIIDELMAIVDDKQRGEAGKEAATVIKRLATQARKAAIDVFLIAHSLLVGQTGLKGASDLMGNFTVVELHKDLDNTRSCYLHLARPGGKKDLVECALPGPFDESRVVIHPDRILSLPPAPTLEEIKIIDAIRGNPGASFGEIARIIGASNSTHTNRKIKAVIEDFSLQGYEIGLKAA